jgi:hypothetical protein
MGAMDTRLNLGWRVCTIRLLLQSFAIEDQDICPTPGDEPLFLQHLQGGRDAGTAHAQHQRQEFMCERQLTAVEAVMRHQQPTRQPLLDFALSVGKGRCGGLQKVCMSVV